VLVTLREASFNQICAAIAHYGNGQFDCAMTLAAAAEGMLPAVNEPHLFQQLRARPDQAELDLNMMINWLKHGGAASADLSDFETVITIARAITKFTAVYRQSHPRFVEFWQRAHREGHLPDVLNIRN